MIDYSVRPPARVGALVALAVTAVAVILFWSTAESGQSVSAGISASVSLDAVSEGANTATSVGTIDSCRALASGETAVLDLVIEDVSGLAGFEVDLVYDPAIIRVVTLTADIEVDYEFLLAPTSTSLIELGDALPDDGSGTFKLGAAQFPSSPARAQPPDRWQRRRSPRQRSKSGRTSRGATACSASTREPER